MEEDIKPSRPARRSYSHVLSVIADHPVNRVDELLPWNVALQSVEPGRVKIAA